MLTLAASVHAQSVPADLPVTRLAVPADAQLPPLPVTGVDPRSLAQLDATQIATVSFAEPAPLHDVFALLLRGTPFGLALDPGVEGTFYGELKDVSLRQAIEIVAQPRGLGFALDGRTIRIFPVRPGTRYFDLNVLADPAAPQVGDPFADVEAGISTLLSPQGAVHVDRVAGLVQVTDAPERLDRVAAYLDAVHAHRARQVRVQARVLTVALRDGREIDWRAVRASLGLAAQPPAAAFAVADFDVLQSALGALGRVRVEAAPEVVVLNNATATLRLGLRDASADARRADSAALTEGLTLRVVPQIGADGIVQLSIAPSWTARPEGRTRADMAASLSVSEAETQVRVYDGDTIVLPGLLRSHDTSEPGGGVAGFFGAERTRTIREATVVLLRPTVVTAGRRPGL
jgi:type II secretory pathway component GspD/PulD (secretin)